MRRHHEELAAAPALITAVTTLIPIGVALWIRVTEWRHHHDAPTPRK
jgi:hypothetical protein